VRRARYALATHPPICLLEDNPTPGGGLARFLLCTVPLTGRIGPGLPIARALVERGHEVRWYTGRRFRAKVEATGARFEPLRAPSSPFGPPYALT
jgi:hypothetical protein